MEYILRGIGILITVILAVFGINHISKKQSIQKASTKGEKSPVIQINVGDINSKENKDK